MPLFLSAFLIKNNEIFKFYFLGICRNGFLSMFPESEVF